MNEASSKRGDRGDDDEDHVRHNVHSRDDKAQAVKTDSSRRSKRRSRDDDDQNEDSLSDRRREKKKHRRHRSDEDDGSNDLGRRHRDKKHSRRKEGKRSSSRHKRRKKRSDSGSSSSESESSSRDDEEREKIVNKRLLAKLEARGETLEERNQRRAQKRAGQIKAKFGYTENDNPFNDPNLHEKFTWKKKEEKIPSKNKAKNTTEFYDEIEKVRKRRDERELQKEEMERIRAEESRMKELENYDEWAKKEELFHLQQQRQRSAIRLVEGREKPIDVLAKNLLLFGLTDKEKNNRASVKYQEKYNAMDVLASLDVELEEPQNLLKKLKLAELKEIRVDIDAFRTLEREATDSPDNPILEYWDSLALVTNDEIKFLKNGGAGGAHGKMVEEVEKIFQGRSIRDLVQMKEEVAKKLSQGAGAMDFDSNYWQSVAAQLDVFLAKATLSSMHSKMLVSQLEKLEERREQLVQQPEKEDTDDRKLPAVSEEGDTSRQTESTFQEGGDLEEELGLSSEVALVSKQYGWQDRYAPRRPRYFNRVRTGYDWNKYNQTHYDRDNPPPKVVQGYKFNIFYPDLIDPTKTPQFRLEPADSDEFCIIRFSAGAPYEDIAFKIVNREWNRQRKKGFKCTFERGVLSLYFNFNTHWYRR